MSEITLRTVDGCKYVVRTKPDDFEKLMNELEECLQLKDGWFHFPVLTGAVRIKVSYIVSIRYEGSTHE